MHQSDDSCCSAACPWPTAKPEDPRKFQPCSLAKDYFVYRMPFQPFLHIFIALYLGNAPAMSSLIPILQDIIPMLRPGKVQVVKSAELDEGTGQTEGMIRKGAIVGMSDHLCASVMIAKPHTCSAVHHHGEQETIVYAASGHGTIVTNPSLTPPPPPPSASAVPTSTDPSSSSSTAPSDLPTNPHLKKQPLAPGDFALIPAWTEHQEVNESDADVVWVVTRSGRAPVVVNLVGWGGREA